MIDKQYKGKRTHPVVVQELFLLSDDKPSGAEEEGPAEDRGAPWRDGAAHVRPRPSSGTGLRSAHPAHGAALGTRLFLSQQ